MEATAGAPQNTVETPLKATGRTLFTAETAKVMAQRSIEARKRNAAAEIERIAQLEAQAKLAAPLLAQAVAITCVPDEQYRLLRLARTREQLEQLDKDLEAAEDEKGKKAICDAIARLSDVEQRLAMRPLPGSRRPGRERPAKESPSTAGPLD